jgi:hypothetical protein
VTPALLPAALACLRGLESADELVLRVWQLQDSVEPWVPEPPFSERYKALLETLRTEDEKLDQELPARKQQPQPQQQQQLGAGASGAGKSSA